jgi:hypothetical protein
MLPLLLPSLLLLLLLLRVLGEMGAPARRGKATTK